jgi:hypothetical protein
VYGANTVTEQFELMQTEEERKAGHKSSVWMPKFMYFTKYEAPPPEIQPMSGGDVYKLTVWWDRPHDKDYTGSLKKGGAPMEFAVFISSDGEKIQVLKMIDTTMVSIRHKRSGAHQVRGEMFTIPQRAWHIPSEFERWAKQHDLDPELHLSHLFCEAVKHQEWAAYSMVRVAVTKGDMTAIFGLNANRTGYFFQDRDVEVGPTGYRKRVFHIVRAHERHLPGKVTPIKIHFRGEREFEWAGYHVKITVPGLDHFLPSEVDVGVTDGYWQEPDVSYVDSPEFGKILKDKMNAGFGGHKR